MKMYEYENIWIWKYFQYMNIFNIWKDSAYRTIYGLNVGSGDPSGSLFLYRYINISMPIVRYTDVSRQTD